jgi:hypothetical protein
MGSEAQLPRLLRQDSTQERRQDHDASSAPGTSRSASRLAGTDCATVRRAWDLHPGDCFHGRVIVAVRGVVGLGSNPVSVLFFAGEGPEHPAQTRIGAAHPEVEAGCDEVWRAARAWVRAHGLHEGQPVDLDRLRAEVLDAVGRS